MSPSETLLRMVADPLIIIRLNMHTTHDLYKIINYYCSIPIPMQVFIASASHTRITLLCAQHDTAISQSDNMPT